MKTLQLLARGLAIYGGTLLLTIIVAETLKGENAWALLVDPNPRPVVPTTATDPSTAPSAPKCRDCTEGYLPIGEFYGAIECNHGGDLDPENCGPNPVNSDCYEISSKTHPVTGKICKCYVCGKSPKKDCEPDFLVWFAWCGYEDVFNEGPNCGVTDPINEPILQRTRPAVTPANDPDCRYDDKHEAKKLCGLPERHDFGCKSKNCTGQGLFKPQKTISTHRRCKALLVPPLPIPTNVDDSR